MSRFGRGAFIAITVMSLLVIPVRAENAEAELETAVSYSISTAEEFIVSATIEAQLLGSRGTGNIAGETELSSAELGSLSEIQPYYAPYERSSRRQDEANSAFIPYSVFEPDERRVVINTTEFPARAVVQISFFVDSKPSACSGVLVAANVVLTAGHCIISNGSWHTNFKIYPGRNGAVKPYGVCGAKNLFSLSAWARPRAGADPREFDMGAIKLDCDIGSRTGWLELRAQDSVDGENTTIRGYPCDKTPAGRQWLSVDEVRSFSSSKIYYQNDTYGCMSGSPVILGSSDDSVFAVHTNGPHGVDDWAENNSGTKLTERRIQLVLSFVGGS